MIFLTMVTIWCQYGHLAVELGLAESQLILSLGASGNMRVMESESDGTNVNLERVRLIWEQRVITFRYLWSK